MSDYETVRSWARIGFGFSHGITPVSEPELSEYRAEEALIDKVLPPKMTPEKEIEYMRRARNRGTCPIPEALTGERREWAQRMGNAMREIQAIDDLIFHKNKKTPTN